MKYPHFSSCGSLIILVCWLSVNEAIPFGLNSARQSTLSSLAKTETVTTTPTTKLLPIFTENPKAINENNSTVSTPHSFSFNTRDDSNGTHDEFNGSHKNKSGQTPVQKEKDPKKREIRENMNDDSAAHENEAHGLQNVPFPTIDKDFEMSEEATATKLSSLHVGEDIAVCWIETTTVKEDPNFDPPKRLVIREFTISFENAGSIPDKYLDNDELEGENAEGDEDGVRETALHEVIDEKTKRSKIVNFSHESQADGIIIRQYKKVKCAVGPVMTKDRSEWPDGTPNPKRRVEITVGPALRDFNESKDASNKPHGRGPSCSANATLNTAEEESCEDSDCQSSSTGKSCEDSDCDSSSPDSSCEDSDCDSSSPDPFCEDADCDALPTVPSCEGDNCNVSTTEPSCEGPNCNTSTTVLPCRGPDCDALTTVSSCEGPNCNVSATIQSCEGPDCDASTSVQSCKGPDCAASASDLSCEGPDCDGLTTVPSCEGPDCDALMTVPSCEGPDCDALTTDPSCEGPNCNASMTDQYCQGLDCNALTTLSPCKGPDCAASASDLSCEGPDCDAFTTVPSCEGPNCNASTTDQSCEGLDCDAPTTVSPCKGPDCAASASNLSCEGPDCDTLTTVPSCEGPNCNASTTDQSCEGLDCDAPTTVSPCKGADCAGSASDLSCEGSNCNASTTVQSCEGSNCSASTTVQSCEGPDCDVLTTVLYCEGPNCNASTTVPSCEGPDCESPPIDKSCEDSDCDLSLAEPSCEDDDCDSSGPDPSCEDADCDSSSTDPPCEGPDCDASTIVPICEGANCTASTTVSPCRGPDCAASTSDPPCEGPICNVLTTVESCEGPDCDALTTVPSCEGPNCNASTTVEYCEGPDCDASTIEPLCEGPNCSVSTAVSPCKGPDCTASTSDSSCEGPNCNSPCKGRDCSTQNVSYEDEPMDNLPIINGVPPEGGFGETTTLKPTVVEQTFAPFNIIRPGESDLLCSDDNKNCTFKTVKDCSGEDCITESSIGSAHGGLCDPTKNASCVCFGNNCISNEGTTDSSNMSEFPDIGHVEANTTTVNSNELSNGTLTENSTEFWDEGSQDSTICNGGSDKCSIPSQFDSTKGTGHVGKTSPIQHITNSYTLPSVEIKNIERTNVPQITRGIGSPHTLGDANQAVDTTTESHFFDSTTGTSESPDSIDTDEYLSCSGSDENCSEGSGQDELTSEPATSTTDSASNGIATTLPTSEKSRTPIDFANDAVSPVPTSILNQDTEHTAHNATETPPPKLDHEAHRIDTNSTSMENVTLPNENFLSNKTLSQQNETTAAPSSNLIHVSTIPIPEGMSTLTSESCTDSGNCSITNDDLNSNKGNQTSSVDITNSPELSTPCEGSSCEWPSRTCEDGSTDCLNNTDATSDLCESTSGSCSLESNGTELPTTTQSINDTDLLTAETGHGTNPTTPVPLRTSNGSHKLAVRVKIMLEHIGENNKKEKLVQLEKHLLFNEKPSDHGNHSLVQQLHALNNSMNLDTFKAIFNCTSLKDWSQDIIDLDSLAADVINRKEVGKKVAGNMNLHAGAINRSVDHKVNQCEGESCDSSDSPDEILSKREKREIPIADNSTTETTNTTDSTKAKSILESLPGVQKDFQAGIDYVLSRIMQGLNDSMPSGVNETAKSSTSKILKMLSNLSDSRVNITSPIRTARSAQAFPQLQELATDEEVERWSKESFVSAADGGQIRSLTEFRIMRDHSGDSSRDPRGI